MVPTILTIENSYAIQQEIELLLSNSCHIMVSSNAVEALNLIYNEDISLLLLDSSTSQANGIELCRTVRGMSQFHNLPIIMLLTRDNFMSTVKCKLAGVTEYLIKPYEPDTLQQLVNRYLYPAIAQSNPKVKIYQKSG